MHEEFERLAFEIFSNWNMAIGAFFMAMVYLYKAHNDIIVIRNRNGMLVRAMNWWLFAMIFFTLAIFDTGIDNMGQRALLRSGFGFLLLSEIGYNLSIILLMLKDPLSKKRLDRYKEE